MRETRTRERETGCGGKGEKEPSTPRGRRGTWKERRDDHPKLVHLRGGLSLLFHFPSRACYHDIYVAEARRYNYTRLEIVSPFLGTTRSHTDDHDRSYNIVIDGAPRAGVISIGGHFGGPRWRR